MTEKTHVSEPLRDPKHSPGVDWMRLENLVGTGAPDINGCKDGVEVWVETKLVKGNRVKFEPMQPAWIRKRVLYGGRVFVFARHKDTFLLWSGFPWTADQVTTLADRSHSVDYRYAQPVLKMDKPYNWPLLMEVLFTSPLKRIKPIATAA